MLITYNLLVKIFYVPRDSNTAHLFLRRTLVLSVPCSTSLFSICHPAQSEGYPAILSK